MYQYKREGKQLHQLSSQSSSGSKWIFYFILFFSDPKNETPFAGQWQTENYASPLYHENKWLNVRTTAVREVTV